MRKLLRLLFLFLFIALLNRPAYSQSLIFKDPVTCLYGLKDKDGNWIMQPKYTLIENFYNAGQTKVMLNEKWGIISAEGKEIVPVIYSGINRNKASYTGITEGDDKDAEIADWEYLRSAYLVNLNGSMGLLDYGGKTILAPEFRSIGNFIDGIAIAETKDYKTAFVSSKGITGYIPEGSTIFPQHISQVSKRRYIFSRQEKNGKTWKIFSGVCDETGKIIIPCRFVAIDQKGKSVNAICVYENNKAGFFSRDGIRLTESIYTIPEKKNEWYNPYLLVETGNGTGVLGKNAALLIPCRYDSLRSYYGGTDLTIFLCVKNNRWTIFDNHGLQRVPSEFEQVIPRITYGESNANYFVVKKEKKWGAILMTGEELIAAEYDTVISSGSYTLYWSPEKVSALKYNTYSNYVALREYQPKEEELPNLQYTFRSLLQWTFIDGYGRDTIFCPVRFIDNEKEMHTKPAKGSFYNYGKFFGLYRAFNESRIKQIVSADSTWYIPDFPEWFIHEWQGEMDMTYPNFRYRFAIKKEKNGKLTIYNANDCLRNEKYSWLSLSAGYEKASLILRSDAKLILDSIPGLTLYGYGFDKKGEPLFRSNSRNYKYGIIDHTGKILVDTNSINIQKISNDSVWIQEKGDAYAQGYWNIRILSSGKMLFAKGKELREPFGYYHQRIIVAGTSAGYGFFDTQTMQFVSEPRYRFIVPLTDDEKHFSVTTFSGKNGIVDSKNKLVCDTVWNRIVSAKKMYDYSSQKKNYCFVLSSQNQKGIFDAKGFHNASGEEMQKAVDIVKTQQVYTSYSYDNGEARITADSDAVFQNWQYALLFDSIFTSPLSRDLRGRYRMNSEQYSEQFGSYFEKWNEHPDYLWSSYNLSHELSGAGKSWLSFRRIKSYSSSMHGPENISYQNFIYRNGNAVYLTLDSLFTGNEWRNFISDTVIAWLNKNPNYDAPCINASAYPYLLNQRFQMTTEGLYLYPDWKDKVDIFNWEAEIFIPWEKLKPYLRKDMVGIIDAGS